MPDRPHAPRAGDRATSPRPARASSPTTSSSPSRARTRTPITRCSRPSDGSPRVVLDDHRGRAGRHDEIFGGGEGLEGSRRAAGRTPSTCRRRRRAAPDPGEAGRARARSSFARGRRCEARPRSQAAGRRAAWIDFPGPPGRSRTQLRRRRERQVQAEHVRGKFVVDRRRRRARCDDEPPTRPRGATHGRARDPGRRDRHRARGLPAARRARLDRRGSHRRARAHPAAVRTALGARSWRSSRVLVAALAYLVFAQLAFNSDASCGRRRRWRPWWPA